MPTLTVNFASVTSSTRKVRQIVHRTLTAADKHGAVVIRGCEAGKVDADWFGPGWTVLHDNQPFNGPRAGTLLAVRRDRVGMVDPRITQVSSGGDGIRARSVAHARLIADADSSDPRAWTDGAFHGPPKRAWSKWLGYMRRLRALDLDVAGGDANKLARAVQPALGRRVRSKHIMTVAVRRSIPSSKARPIDVGSDHPALLVMLWP